MKRGKQRARRWERGNSRGCRLCSLKYAENFRRRKGIPPKRRVTRKESGSLVALQDKLGSS